MLTAQDVLTGAFVATAVLAAMSAAQAVLTTLAACRLLSRISTEPASLASPLVVRDLDLVRYSGLLNFSDLPSITRFGDR